MFTSDTAFLWNSLELKKEIEGKEITLSILPSLNSITLNESIFSKLVSGSITFTDEWNMFNKYPFTGNETISFTIEDLTNNKDKIEFEYEAYSYEYSVPSNSLKQIITIYFIDKNYKKFIKEYSTSFSEKKISEFISEFSEDVLGKELFKVEETKGKFTFAFPYQKFHYMLSYLNQYAQNSKKHVGYLYFTNILDEAYYVPVSYLLSQEPKLEFHQVQPNHLTGDNDIFSKYEIENSLNLSNMGLAKGFGFKTYMLNHEDKSVIEDEFEYKDIFEEEIFLGKYGIINKGYSGITSTYFASTDNSKTKLLVWENVIKSSDSIIISNLNGTFERTVGKTAYIRFLDRLYDKKSDETNSAWSGNYLITDIGHTLTTNSYKQKIRFIKNARMTKTSNDQPSISSSKQNI